VASAQGVLFFSATGGTQFQVVETGAAPPPETTAPVVTSFTMPSTSSSLTVAVTSFTATDNVGVTGYLITESSTTPTAGSAGWSATAPTSFTFSSSGTVTAYAWAKDAAGNVSSSVSASVNITTPLTQLTMNDALKVYNALNGVAPLSAADQVRYDLAPLGSNGSPQGNGEIDIADVILIMRISMGLVSW